MSEKIDRYIARYLRLSRPLFGPKAVPSPDFFRDALNNTLPVAENYDFETLRAFAETEFNNRALEIARVASQLRPIPEFHFLYLKSTSYQAQAIRNFERPLVFLDADLKTFFFLFFATRLYEIYWTSDRDTKKHFNSLCLHAMEDYASRAPIHKDDVDKNMEMFRLDEHLTSVAASLSCVACYYIIAHEIGHLIFDDQAERSPFETELDCDAFAARVLSELRNAAGLDWANVPIGYLFTPLIVAEIWELFSFARRVEGMPFIDQEYPAPRVRRERMGITFEAAHPDDCTLYFDMRLSISRLKTQYLAKSDRSSSDLRRRMCGSTT